MDTTTPKTKWTLTSESFEKLLFNLSPDSSQAADKYEKLRQKLIRFFRLKSVTEPEEMSDEVFNRVARRLEENAVELAPENPDGYFLQTARFVFLEDCRGARKRISSLEDLPYGAEPFEDPVKLLEKTSERIEKEMGLEVLSKCRAELGSDELLMIDVYGYGTGRERIKARQALAERLGKTLNSLRIDVCRVNAKLKKCAIKNLEKALGIKF